MTHHQITRLLADAGIENAAFESRLLLEHFCGVSQAALLASPEEDHPSPALARAVAARAARTPLQYLLGYWEFYRQTYEVNESCLIPRADTELLVEEAIRRLPPRAHFADLCTGSGCIAVSVLAERCDTDALAVDKFRETLALAERNAVANGVRERFVPLCADLLSPETVLPQAPFDAILSNPPYVATAEWENLSPEVRAEPRAALDGGEDGLLFYRTILQKYASALKKEGFFLFEIGYDQADALRDLGIAHGFAGYRLLRDLEQRDRAVLLTRDEPTFQ